VVTLERLEADYGSDDANVSARFRGGGHLIRAGL